MSTQHEPIADVQGPLPAAIWKLRQRGFDLRYYARGQKYPTSTVWASPDSDAARYRPDSNVGFLTGTEIEPGRFVHDADFDVSTPETRRIAKRILPPTNFGFGRAGKPCSHAIYTLPKPIVTRQYSDIDGTMLFELRGTKADGSIGYQTMAPPSVHPSGEVIEFVADGDIGHVESGLPEDGTLYAIAVLLLRHLGPGGDGHDVRLAVAAFLLKAGLDETSVRRVAEALADATGNDVDDAALTVRTTAKKVVERTKGLKGRKFLINAIGTEGEAVVKRIEEWLHVTDAGGIYMAGGALTDVLDRAETALLARKTPIYQRAGTLVHPVRLDAQHGEPSEVRRAPGAMVLSQVRESWLIEQMGLAASWYAFARDGGWRRADPKPLYARTLLSRVDRWRFPVLRGVLTAPTLDRDGRVIETPGYDPASGLLLDFPPGAFPPVPQRPSRDDALVALEQLAHPLRAFPFVDEASKAVALAALLTSVIRMAMRTAPLHAFDAPTAGTGKSMLAELAGILATGVRPAALSQGKTAEEDEKRLNTVLAAGDPVIHIDNCEHAISGDFLCSMLTQEIVQARILGLSERRIMPSTALVLASGNNLTFVGDISRRAVRCRLDAKVERPESREFDFDPQAEVLASRPQLVVAALTILRAYDVAGRPERVRPMGSFADYAFVRGALLWLGCGDPKDTLDEILDDDPKKDELRTVMELWEAAVGDRAIEVGDIDKCAEDAATNFGALREALIAVACRGQWSAKSVGWWLRKQKDRVNGGKAFRREGSAGDHVRWRLAGAKAQEALSFEGEPPAEWEGYGRE